MGIVYLINSGTTDRYKIGVSKSPPSRIRGLQTGNPQKLTLVDYYESPIYQNIETILHRTMKHKKYVPEDFEMLKGEWFILNNEDVGKFKIDCIKIEANLIFVRGNSTLNIGKV